MFNELKKIIKFAFKDYMKTYTLTKLETQMIFGSNQCNFSSINVTSVHLEKYAGILINNKDFNILTPLKLYVSFFYMSGGT